MPVPEYKVCTHRMLPTDTIPGVCRECGHTGLVHPSVGNPSLRACALCEMMAATVALVEQAQPKVLVVGTSEKLSTDYLPRCGATKTAAVNYETGKHLDPYVCVRHVNHTGPHQAVDSLGDPLYNWLL